MINKIIETNRLVLRPFSSDDIEALFILLSDKEVNKYLPWFPLRSIEEAKTFYKERLSNPMCYAICLKGNNSPIGYVQIDDAHDLGYALLKEYWGKGIAAEASLALLNEAKDTLPFVTATHDINNKASGRVMEKIGMKYCYTYKEQWEIKNIPVWFRLYQINFSRNNDYTYMVNPPMMKTHYTRKNRATYRK